MTQAPPGLAAREHVQLRVANDEGVHALRTQLEWFDDVSGRLCVAWPTPDARLFPLHAGQPVTLEVSRPSDALYTVEALLESASTEEPPQVVLRPTAPWHRVQRRQTLRYAVEMRPTTTLRLRGSADAQAISAVLSDLSTGGMRITSDSEVEPGDRLELAFGTPSGGAELRLRVTVLRVVPVRRDGRPRWEAGCQFVEPTEGERDQIVQFILAQQSAARSA